MKSMMDGLDIKIKRANLITQIESLYCEISRLQKALNELAPIYSLSPELLALIFSAVEVLTEPKLKRNTLCTLMSVSHRWESVVLEAPELWTSIVWTPTANVRWITKCAERSKHVGSLSLYAESIVDMPWEVVAPIFPRFQEILLNDLRLPEGEREWSFPTSLQKLGELMNASRSIQTIHWKNCQYRPLRTDLFLRFLPSSLRTLSFESGRNLTPYVVYQTLVAAPLLDSLHIFNDVLNDNYGQGTLPIPDGHPPLVRNHLRDLKVTSCHDCEGWVVLIDKLRLPTNADIQLCIFDENYRYPNQDSGRSDPQLQFEYIKQAIGGIIPSIESVSIVEKRCQGCALYEVTFEYHAGAPGRRPRLSPAFTQLSALIKGIRLSERLAPLERVIKSLPLESLQNMRSFAYHPIPRWSDGREEFPDWLREMIRQSPNLRSISVHHTAAVDYLAGTLEETLSDSRVDNWMPSGPSFPSLDEVSIVNIFDGSWPSRDVSAAMSLIAALRGRKESGRRIPRRLVIYDGNIRAETLSALQKLVEEVVVGGRIRIDDY